MLRLPDTLSKAEKLQKVNYKLYLSIDAFYMYNVVDLAYIHNSFSEFEKKNLQRIKCLPTVA